MGKKSWTQLWLADHCEKDGCTEILPEGFSPDNPIIKNAIEELPRGVYKTIRILLERELPREGFRLQEAGEELCLSASSEAGALYGAFHLKRHLAVHGRSKKPDLSSAPDNPLRMLNHWDNMDGSIERGYSGDSFFFRNGEILVDERTRDYARLVSSVGINAVVINNVNVKGDATFLISERYLPRLSEMAEIFAGYGIRLFLSLNFASPMELGGMDTCDPADPAVIAWWDRQFRLVYDAIPALGGFLVKADSEGRPGPFTYGHTQDAGANMLADRLAPYGGLVIWRCFVYNCTQDWRDYKTDRARAGYDYFHDLDGKFRDNVILQIKNGPMDFQIREPVSPLFGGMEKTNQMLEVQIAQEYTGQQIDLCYLIPLFKEVLSFKTGCAAQHDTVADIISGRTFGNIHTGIAAVCNTGNDENWTGHDLAAANLYGFGRLAWDMSLSSETIAREWIAQTFTLSGESTEKLLRMLLHSREIYEQYSAPLGIGWMVNPAWHYGPSVDGYEYSRWGTYHRADHLGLGVDRTDKGTGYAQQYREENAAMYNNPDTCPEELLLFFHRVLYKTRLKSGKTLIQHIYDSHFEGAEGAEKMASCWKSLEPELDPAVYNRVLRRFEMQVKNAAEWRDQVNSYFYRKSGIQDEKNRVIY